MANMNQQLNCECQLHVGLNYSNHFPINGESCWKNVIPWHSHSLSKFDTNQWHIKGDIIQMFIYMGVSKIWGTPKWMVYNGNPQLQWMIWGVSFSHPPGHWPISKVQLQDLGILGSSCWARSAAWRAAEDPNSMRAWRIKPNAAALQQGANKISESSPAMAGLRLTKSCLAVVPIQLYGLISCISCFLEMPRLEQHKGLVWQTVWHLRTQQEGITQQVQFPVQVQLKWMNAPMTS